jgi:ribonucleoside-diphosphate reductase alpha chain
MGTQYVYERGSHALNNCGAVAVETVLSEPARWLMDSLMCGVGVGFTTNTAKLKIKGSPRGKPMIYIVPDTKEGWAESVAKLIRSYEQATRPVEFDYTAIRPKGSLIKGFGGISSGPAPLKKLHTRVRKYLDAYVSSNKQHQTRLIADVMNSIGACVVSGNVRRSAELAVGAGYDEEFLGLKDYTANPDRAEIGWMSNNSIALGRREDFTYLPDLAERIQTNGEPGIINLINVKKYGRTGERHPDDAVAVNPCGEIPLESYELCNLVETFPTRCNGDLGRIFELGTFYASTVSLLRSHSQPTNEVVARNRRIGVSVSGVADWLDSTSVSHVFDALNRGYDIVKAANRKLARDAGVAESIRVTTVKPSGTVSLLAGVSSGMHFPIGGHALRRVRISSDSPVANLLVEAGIPHEPDVVSDHTTVFEFPLRYGEGKTRGQKHVSVFEQAAIVAMLQRCWADNAVSNTLSVQPDEMKQVERVLSLFAPQVKSLSMMPDREDVYEQMPVEHLTKGEFESRANLIAPVDWSSLIGSDGDAADSAYCTTDSCEVPQRA